MRVRGVPCTFVVQLPPGLSVEDAERYGRRFVEDLDGHLTTWLHNRRNFCKATACFRCGRNAENVYALNTGPCLQDMREAHGEVWHDLVSGFTVVQKKTIIGYQPNPSNMLQVSLVNAFFSREASDFAYRWIRERGWSDSCEVCDVRASNIDCFLYASDYLDAERMKKGKADGIGSLTWLSA